MEPGHMTPLWHACSVLTLQLVEGIRPGEAVRPRIALLPANRHLLAIRFQYKYSGQAHISDQHHYSTFPASTAPVVPEFKKGLFHM